MQQASKKITRLSTTGWRKLIHRELRRLKFDHSTKWYLHKLEFVPENKTHKILWDYDIRTDDPD